jgi:aminoglycoside phosphotransferase (APT) family kinase protein
MLSTCDIEALTAHLADRLEARVEIVSQHRIHGGASRETYTIDALVGGTPTGLILRRDPADSLIDTERAVEFAGIRSFEGAGLPIPRAISLVETNDILGAPFFVMERIDGGSAASPFVRDPYGEHRAAIGSQFFALLGGIHARETASCPLAHAVDVPTPDACWRRELDYWEGVIETDALEPQPIVCAAIRHLRRIPPPPPKKVGVVHGDYRSGNFLHDGAGKIIAILDWEMAHIGDPMEDLAWALDPLWSLQEPDLAAAMLPRDNAISEWEAASGQTFDEASYRWWSLFANVKGMAIWISSAKSYSSGGNIDPVLGFSGWFAVTEHNRIIARRLAEASGA